MLARWALETKSSSACDIRWNPYIRACILNMFVWDLPSVPVKKVLPVLLALFQISQRRDGAIVLHAIKRIVLTVINVWHHLENCFCRVAEANKHPVTSTKTKQILGLCLWQFSRNRCFKAEFRESIIMPSFYFFLTTSLIRYQILYCPGTYITLTRFFF